MRLLKLIVPILLVSLTVLSSCAKAKEQEEEEEEITLYDYLAEEASSVVGAYCLYTYQEYPSNILVTDVRTHEGDTYLDTWESGEIYSSWSIVYNVYGKVSITDEYKDTYTGKFVVECQYKTSGVYFNDEEYQESRKKLQDLSTNIKDLDISAISIVDSSVTKLTRND